MANRLTAIRALAIGGAALSALLVASRASSGAPAARPALQSGRFAAECLSEHPFFVTTRFNDPDGDLAPAVIAFRWSLSGGERYTLAREDDVGAVYGLAVSTMRATTSTLVPMSSAARCSAPTAWAPSTASTSTTA